MLTDSVTIINKLGLHARAAALMANTAARYSSSIKAGVKDKMVDAKSVMSLMLLAANQGSQLQLEVAGEDQEEAMSAMVDLIADRFGEDE